MSGQNPQNSGRQQTDSAGYPRYDRDAQRAWNHQRRKQPPSDRWADDIPFEDPPANDRRKERNKNRMKDFKKSKQQSQPVKPERSEPEKAVKEDSAQDAPLYDATPFTSGVPFNQEYSQNFDCAGFPIICQEIYATMEGLNPRLSRDMPFPMFLHNMNCVLQTHTLKQKA